MPPNDQCDFYQLAEIILRLISISRAHALSDDGDEYWESALLVSAAMDHILWAMPFAAIW